MSANQRPGLPLGRVSFVIGLGLAGLALAHLPAVLHRLLDAYTPEGVTFDGPPPAGSTFLESWFYILAWWSYIVLASGIVHILARRSLLLDRPRVLALLALHSAAFWLAFEVVNLRLQNWYYVGVPPDWISRWPGMFLAFATVLPGVFVTFELVGATGLFAGTRSRSIPLSPTALRGLTITGLVFLILPLALPTYAYPLIWGSFVFLAEPWLYRRGERCLLRYIADGRWTVPLRLLLAGAFAGLLWESWNSLAASKWIYTVPFFEDLKLFEMPVLGFLGFPPFALECYTFGRLAVALGWVPEWELDVELQAERPRHAVLAGLAAALFSVPAIGLVNKYTVRATQPQVSELSGITPETLAFLTAHGIETVHGLHSIFYDYELAPKIPMQHEDHMRWLDEGHLMQVKGMGSRGVRWLGAVDILRRSELARQDATALFNDLRAVEGPPPRPTSAEVRVWVRGAQRDAVAPCCSADERIRFLESQRHDRVRLEEQQLRGDDLEREPGHPR